MEACARPEVGGGVDAPALTIRKGQPAGGRAAPGRPQDASIGPVSRPRLVVPDRDRSGPGPAPIPGPTGPLPDHRNRPT